MENLNICKLCMLQGAASGCSIAGGLAWAGVLAFGVISEQIKTRIEGSSEARNTVVSHPYTPQAMLPVQCIDAVHAHST